MSQGWSNVIDLMIENQTFLIVLLQWTKPGFVILILFGLKSFVCSKKRSSDKVFAYILWDKNNIILLNYLEHEKSIMAYYASLLITLHKKIVNYNEKIFHRLFFL